MSSVTTLNFVFTKFSVSVLINCLENAGKLLSFGFTEELTSNESKGSGLNNSVWVEMNKIVQSWRCDTLINVEFGMILDPLVLKALFGGGTSSTIIGEQRRNKVLGRLADSFPHWVVEAKLTGLDCIHDFLIWRSVEWRNSGQDNIGHHTKWPDVTLLSIAVLKDFRSNIIGSANCLFKVLSLLKGLGCSKINDLDLVEGFVCFEKNVLRLKVSVHNIVGVAVSDAG